jgi:deoxyribodipyrimidine photo-lyase
MNLSPVLLWFRQDLRLQDNLAFNAAVARGGPIIPVYILDRAGEGHWPPGAAARWWLHHSLAALVDGLRAHRSRLVLVRGDSLQALQALVGATAAGAVYWNRRYEPVAAARDQGIAVALAAGGLEVKSFDGGLLFEPQAVTNKAGRPFRVFSPFWRHCRTLPVAAPTRWQARDLPAPARWPRSRTLDELELLPAVKWHADLARTWRPGEPGAHVRLKQFAARSLDAYADSRNRPDRDGTSRLSPHLHFGEISPRQVWAAVRRQEKKSASLPSGRGRQVFLGEIGWREFAGHLLHHFPDTPAEPLRAEFRMFPWRRHAAKLRAWQRGRTGYPIVDAGMRQLWHTGWMHNRVRMIVASFLIKDLLIPWQEGAKWFWDTLVDADLANNTLGWQWTTGCGADAAPYFRVFNPVLQGRKFDPDGLYVRRWVPELVSLRSTCIHAPWEAMPEVLAGAGVKLGRTYPWPLVDHRAARAEALTAYEQMKQLHGEALGRDVPR